MGATAFIAVCIAQIGMSPPGFACASIAILVLFGSSGSFDITACVHDQNKNKCTLAE